jgi:predicted nucleic acid-binding protein
LIILDTSVWIEHLKSNRNFFQKIRNLLERGEILAVECVFGELLQGLKNKLLNHGVDLIDSIILMHGIKSGSKIWTLDNKFLRIIPKELIYRE